MNKLVKLLIPLGLGVLAAAINWFGLKDRTAPAVFVKVKDNVRAGERFTADHLERVELHGEPGSLAETAIPYRHRAVLYNSPCLRDLKKGDLVLWRDLNPQLEPGEDQLPVSLDGVSVVHPRLLVVGNEVTFIIDRSAGKSRSSDPSSHAGKDSETRPDLVSIGPFRILTVDGNVARPEKESDRGRDRLITVAVRRTGENGALDERTTQLLEAIKARKDNQHRFVEIILNAARRS